MIDISIVIPVYNSSEILSELVKKYTSQLKMTLILKLF